jgi:type IV pilus biogenesis protein CpaD/CtpE
VTACGDYTPAAKHAVYDPQTGDVALPHPCPDWSKNSVVNYSNSNHSNFGCATANNAALQLEDPRDLHQGHGDQSPDMETTTHVVERYRLGELPTPLEPQQSAGTEGQ